MTRLAQEAAVVRLASELGLDRADPVTAVTDYCKKRIASLVGKAGGVRTIRDLEQVICRELRLVFEEVRSDNDLEAVIQKYVGMGEYVFAHLRDDFDDHTFATLLERQHVDATHRDRYVAIIDCRGSKVFRRFFTRWHEIAHLLTLGRQLELPFHRSSDRDPMERLMDVVAGEVGFYEPIFVPVLHRELEERDLGFDIVDQVRVAVCPDASFQATTLACVRHAPRPTLYVEYGPGLKKQERLRMRQPGLFPEAGPSPKLRALTVIANEPARKQGLHIHRNMQIPKDSLLYFDIRDDEYDVEPERTGVEDLSLWKHSDGTKLASTLVRAQTRRVGDHGIALLFPIAR